MLVITRKEGEEVYLDGARVVVRVLGTGPGGRVRLGFSAPKEVSIRRGENVPESEKQEVPDRDPA